MGKRSKMVVLGGLGLGALMVMGTGAGWAGIPADQSHRKGTCIVTQSDDSGKIILAGRGGRGGGRGNPGGDSTTWGGCDGSGNGRGYGLQDGSGSAPRPLDGTGYGAKKGAGSGTCDGTGPKGKGRGGR
jgi:hypothetical protein